MATADLHQTTAYWLLPWPEFKIEMAVEINELLIPAPCAYSWTRWSLNLELEGWTSEIQWVASDRLVLAFLPPVWWTVCALLFSQYLAIHFHCFSEWIFRLDVEVPIPVHQRERRYRLNACFTKQGHEGPVHMEGWQLLLTLLTYSMSVLSLKFNFLSIRVPRHLYLSKDS